MSKDAPGQNKSDQPETLAEMLVLDAGNEQQRRQLEEYRIKFEAVHGPTDLTKRYTSTWPAEQQHWLMRNDIKRYFDGLPPFVKAFYRGQMEIQAREGNLDVMPDNWLRLFAKKQMILDHEKKRHR
jgi:hypothetical protein